MKTTIAILIALACARLSAEDFTTVEGKKYEGVTISRVEPDGLMVVTDSGIAKIPFLLLPEDVQKKYGYDPKAAAEFSAGVAKAQRDSFARGQKALQDEQAKKTAEWNAREREGRLAAALNVLKESGIIRAIEVSQINDDGVLARVAPALEVSEKVYKRTGEWQDEPVYIYLKNTKALIDGKTLGGHLYPVGRMQYTTVLAATKTVAAFAVSPEHALELIQSR